jgi:hypothetical protein
MFIKDLVNCDLCDEKQVLGFHFFARGATGRVCNVLDVCHECDGNSRREAGHTIEEVEKWAESEPGGYLDY